MLNSKGYSKASVLWVLIIYSVWLLIGNSNVNSTGTVSVSAASLSDLLQVWNLKDDLLWIYFLDMLLVP